MHHALSGLDSLLAGEQGQAWLMMLPKSTRAPGLRQGNHMSSAASLRDVLSPRSGYGAINVCPPHERNCGAHALSEPPSHALAANCLHACTHVSQGLVRAINSENKVDKRTHDHVGNWPFCNEQTSTAALPSPRMGKSNHPATKAGKENVQRVHLTSTYAAKAR